MLSYMMYINKGVGFLNLKKRSELEGASIRIESRILRKKNAYQHFKEFNIHHFGPFFLLVYRGSILFLDKIGFLGYMDRYNSEI